VADKQGKLRELNENLERECEKAGFAKEKRNFKPHLTIARLREPHKSTLLVERHLMEEFLSEKFEVSEIVIYESLLQKTGSIYSIVSKHQLIENLTADKG
jgi:2'-5' RNA ligase